MFVRNEVTTGLWTQTRGRGIRVVFLHGFTQTARSWDPVLEALESSIHSSFEAVLPDLPGHGRSHSTATGLEQTAELLAKSCGPAIYVGYSMGGRLALHVALAHPEVVRGLLLFGATPGLKTERERTQRSADDELLAQDLESVGVPAFLEKWLRNPLFATLPDNPQDLQLRRENTVAGLASSLRLAGTGSQSPLWESLNTISTPTIVAAGDRDHKFTAIAQTTAQAIGTNASMCSITNAGHPCHLEQPHQAAELLHKLAVQL